MDTKLRNELKSSCLEKAEIAGITESLVIERFKKEWERISKENVQVRRLSGVIYGFCSELASLRLLKAYRKSENADCGYSENLKTFYFRIEL